MISAYNAEPYGVKNLMQIVAKEVRVSGFIVGNLYHKVCSCATCLLFFCSHHP